MLEIVVRATCTHEDQNYRGTNPVSGVLGVSFAYPLVFQDV